MNRAKGEAVNFTKEPYIDDAGPRRIDGIKFSTLSSTEIEKIGEVQVWKAALYECGKPASGGLSDARMGPPNKSLTCETCHGSFEDCQGHYGYLKLAHPVYNVGSLKKIVKILKCICKECACILLNDDTHNKYLTKMRKSKTDDERQKIHNSIINICEKVVKCPLCGYNNGKVKKVPSPLSIVHGSRPLDPFQVLCLFRRMRDKDCELLCIDDRPEKLIMTNIAVPPNAVRPSTITDGVQSIENDITMRLMNIIRENAALSQELTKPNGSQPCKFQV